MYLHSELDMSWPVLIAQGTDALINVAIQVNQLAHFKYDHDAPANYSTAQMTTPLLDETYPVIHPATLSHVRPFRRPEAEEFVLQIELSSMNGPHRSSACTSFSDLPFKRVSREIEYRPGMPPNVVNQLCTDDPWETVRPLSMKEIEAKNASPADV
jgi:hypothetical protein